MVHYTMRMVNSQIGQYERELQEALDKSLNKSVVANRQKWLTYWRKKKNELMEKGGYQVVV